jgi:thiamine biosynthesis lipoprotein
MLAVTASCAPVETQAPAETRFEYERPEMGVPFRIVLYATNQAAADRAAERAFQRVQQLNDIMSDYDADSELSKLSRTSGQGQEVRVSDELWFVLQRAQTLAERSGGAFDVTVGPYVSLWRRARRQRELPEPERLAQAGKAVGVCSGPGAEAVARTKYSSRPGRGRGRRWRKRPSAWKTRLAH